MKPIAESAEQNKDVILQVLKQEIPEMSNVLDC